MRVWAAGRKWNEMENERQAVGGGEGGEGGGIERVRRRSRRPFTWKRESREWKAISMESRSIEHSSGVSGAFFPLPSGGHTSPSPAHPFRLFSPYFCPCLTYARACAMIGEP